MPRPVLASDNAIAASQPINSETSTKLQRAVARWSWCRRATWALPAVLVSGLAWSSGALVGELSAAPDEAAHFVTGLMIHDYAKTALFTPPLEFAERFYLHYPKVAFGVWPPLFHLVEAGWMLVFSPSRVTVLVLMVLLTTAIAYVLARLLKPRLGTGWAILSALLLVSLAQFQASTGIVMADTFLTLWSVLAAVAFVKYLERGRWQESVLFGVLASLALLTKYNAAALALLPPLALVLGRRVEVVRHWTFWLSAAVVLFLTSPWYFLNRQLVVYASLPYPDQVLVPEAVMGNLRLVVDAFGPILTACAALGAVVTLGKRGRVEPPWAVLAALGISTWIFHGVFYPAVLGRYMLPLFFAVAAFVIAGLDWIVRYVKPRWAPWLGAAVACGCLALYLGLTFTIWEKPFQGYRTIAEYVLGRADDTVLVSADVEGEGSLVSEVALRDRRPGHVVLRASKMLASSTWMGRHYQPFVRSTADVLRVLDQLGVSLVVVDRVGRQPQHHYQLAEALRAAPHRWHPVRLSHPSSSPQPTRQLLVYEAIGPVVRPPLKSLRIDMKYSLGKSIGY
jgi:Dolichyl-phosphate-mannose-protein mannosyltransferase